MRKPYCTLLMLVLMLSTLVTAVAAASRDRALVVCGNSITGIGGEGDLAISVRLEKRGFILDSCIPELLDELELDKYKLVYISETVSAAEVGTRFTDSESFVICSEPGLWDELLIGNYDPTYDTNPYDGDITVTNDIVKSGLKIFPGFTKEATPGFLKDYAEGVEIIAENANRAPAVVLAKKGAVMLDKSFAKGARATFYNRGQSAADFTEQSWRLFDSLVNTVIPKAGQSSSAPDNFDRSSLYLLIAAAAFVGIQLSKKHLK